MPKTQAANNGWLPNLPEQHSHPPLQFSWADAISESEWEIYRSAIHALRSVPVTRSWLATSFRREATSALLLGVACGLVVSAIVWLWRNDFLGALVTARALSAPAEAAQWLEQLNAGPRRDAAAISVALKENAGAAPEHAFVSGHPLDA